jgi:hypothetical protein
MKITPRIKQLQSISKAITNSVLVSSTNYTLKKLTLIEAELDLNERIKGVQKRYGFPLCIVVFPDILKRIKERLIQTIKVTSNGKEELIKVSLLVKPMEEWISKFLPERANTKELDNNIPDVSD